jgi:hypothetical protein
MKPCASCKTPAACAKAGKCAATGKPLGAKPKPMSMPASKKKTGRYY